ncbi:MAG TPA: purine-nucleoside phosphorylase [Coriobacteriia bacterium]|nr:purine-nucleoside phosphorylase [Coriobacteriia bacterium]
MAQIDLSAFPGDVSLVRSQMDGDAEIALVLGSGLDSVVDSLSDRHDIAYSEIEGMRGPHSVAGHAGRMSLGTVGGKRVVCFRGRVHRYQGVSAYQAAYPARFAKALGAKTLIVTNAAGSVDPELPAGAVMLITDQLNLTGDNPLVGWPGPAGGTPFIPMGDAYDPELRRLSEECATETGVELSRGVYAGLLGPTYETPAEVSYLHLIGANAVGMSTVPEVIVARALGMRVLGFSLITNAAGGGHLSHDEVLEAGKRGGERLAKVISAVLGKMP